MTGNVLVFAGTSMMLGFLFFHSLWRFFLRRFLPSLVHSAMAALVFVYAALDFQERTVNWNPSTISVVVALTVTIGCVLVVRFELKQEHPWN